MGPVAGMGASDTVGIVQEGGGGQQFGFCQFGLRYKIQSCL